MTRRTGLMRVVVSLGMVAAMESEPRRNAGNLNGQRSGADALDVGLAAGYETCNAGLNTNSLFRTFCAAYLYTRSASVAL